MDTLCSKMALICIPKKKKCKKNDQKKNNKNFALRKICTLVHDNVSKSFRQDKILPVF